MTWLNTPQGEREASQASVTDLTEMTGSIVRFGIPVDKLIDKLVGIRVDNRVDPDLARV